MTSIYIYIQAIRPLNVPKANIGHPVNEGIPWLSWYSAMVWLGTLEPNQHETGG